MSRENLATTRMPVRAMGCALVCGVLILVLCAAGVYPVMLKRSRLKGKIRGMQEELQRSRSLQPIHNEINVLLQKQCPAGLGLPPRDPLSRAQITDLPTVFAGLAVQSGLRFVSAEPHVETLPTDETILVVDVKARGPFAAFRKLLVHVGALASLEHVEALEITKVGDAEEGRLRVWLAVE